MSTAVFYSLSRVCQYLTMYLVLVLCQCVHRCFLLSVSYLYVLHTKPTVRSVTPCPLHSCTFCPLSVYTQHWNVCWFCVTVSTAVFYNFSNVCQYLAMYVLLVLRHYVHCSLVRSVHSLSVHHTVPSVDSLPLWLQGPSTVCQLSVSTPHSTVCWFSVSVYTAAFFSLQPVC